MAVINNIISEGLQGPSGVEGSVPSGVIFNIAMQCWKLNLSRTLLADVCCDNFYYVDGVGEESTVVYNPAGYVECPLTSSGITASVTTFNNTTFSREDFNQAYCFTSSGTNVGVIANSYGVVVSPSAVLGKELVCANEDRYVVGRGLQNKELVSLDKDWDSKTLDHVYAIKLAGGEITPSLGNIDNITLEYVPLSGMQLPELAEHSMVYVPDTNCIYIFGGATTSTISNDLWCIDCSSWVAQQLDPPITPSARTQHSLVYNSASGTLLLFGGVVGSGIVNDLWEYSIASNVWDQLNPTGAIPGVRAGHCAGFDNLNNQMLIWGGRSVTSATSELFQYQTASGGWAKLVSLTSTAPTNNLGMRGDYDPAFQSFVFYGGDNGTASTANSWSYSIEHNYWVQQNSTVPVTFHTTALDPTFRVLGSIGGLTEQGISPIIGFHELNNNCYQTTNFNEAGLYGAAVVFNSQDNYFYVYGGRDRQHRRQDKLYRFCYKQYNYAKGINVAITTDASHFITGGWSHLDSLQVTQDCPLPANVYYAVSFDGRVTWKIYKPYLNWYSIARLYGGVWQYRLAAGGWESAVSNNLETALRQAMSITTNQWSRSRFDEYNEQEISTIPSIWNNVGYMCYTASASSENSATKRAWYAFNGYYAGLGDNYYWQNLTTPMANAWLQIDCGHRVFCPTAWRFRNGYSANRSPKRFSLIASNDLSQWDALDTTYSGVDHPAVASDVFSNWFLLTTSNTYRYYRVVFYSTQSDANYVNIRKIDFKSNWSINALNRNQWEAGGGWQEGATQSIDIAVGLDANKGIPHFKGITASYTTTEQPTTTLILKEWELTRANPIRVQFIAKCKLLNSLDLTKDISIEVSMNSGTNWDTLNNFHIFTSGNYDYIWVDNTGLIARGGSSILTRIMIHNYKKLYIYGCCLAVSFN